MNISCAMYYNDLGVFGSSLDYYVIPKFLICYKVQADFIISSGESLLIPTEGRKCLGSFIYSKNLLEEKSKKLRC